MYKHLIQLNNFDYIILIDSILAEQEAVLNKFIADGFIEFETAEQEIFHPELEVKAWGEWGEENSFIPHYYYDRVENQILRRPEEDITTDRISAAERAAAIANIPTLLDRIQAQTTYTAIMTNTLLEEE